MSRSKRLDFDRLHCIIGLMDFKDVWLDFFFSLPLGSGSELGRLALLLF